MVVQNESQVLPRHGHLVYDDFDFQVPKSQLEQLYPNISNSAISQPPPPPPAAQQPAVSTAPTAAAPPAAPAPQASQQEQQSQQNTTMTAIPLVTSSVSTQNVRTFTDLTGESSITVDPIIGQSGLELSTIDPSSHHQLLGHMPLVATSSGHMGHMTSPPDGHHTMTVGQPAHQNPAVISQLIHPNSYITGLSNGMSMPPHLSHAHPHYQM